MRLLATLFLFVTFALRPAMEVSTLLYYTLNVNYIVETYCVNKSRPRLQCDGKCYLSKQLNFTKQSTSTTTTPLAEAFIPLFFQECTLYIQNRRCEKAMSSVIWSRQCFKTMMVYTQIEHPPNYFIS